jgi:hypothetical protein
MRSACNSMKLACNRRTLGPFIRPSFLKRKRRQSQTTAVLRAHQRPSDVIHWQSGVIRSNQWQSEAIRGNQRQSEAIHAPNGEVPSVGREAQARRGRAQPARRMELMWRERPDLDCPVVARGREPRQSRMLGEGRDGAPAARLVPPITARLARQPAGGAQ